MTMEISNLAGAVATAMVGVEQAAAALVEAEEHRDLIRRRIDEKQAERAEIVGARKAGVETKTDGARLMTITVDAENLGELLSAAEVIVAKSTKDAAEAKRLLAQAEGDLTRATDTEMLRRLIEHAVAVDAQMVGTIREIEKTWKRLGRSPGRESWVPTPALAEAIKRLDLTRENRR